MKYLLAFALLTSTASAAPFLKTTGDFQTSSFCKAHTCKRVATVPSNALDQLHYDVDNRWRVIVWRYPDDLKRLGGRDVKLRNQVQGVSMVWYGLQETPFGSEKTFAELVSFATGKPLTSSIALTWLDDSRGQGRDWGEFAVTQRNGVLPGFNAAILEMMVSVRPF